MPEFFEREKSVFPFSVAVLGLTAVCNLEPFRRSRIFVNEAELFE